LAAISTLLQKGSIAARKKFGSPKTSVQEAGMEKLALFL
jgi:hypothetical protein